MRHGGDDGRVDLKALIELDPSACSHAARELRRGRGGGDGVLAGAVERDRPARDALHEGRAALRDSVKAHSRAVSDMNPIVSIEGPTRLQAPGLAGAARIGRDK